MSTLTTALVGVVLLAGLFAAVAVPGLAAGALIVVVFTNASDVLHPLLLEGLLALAVGVAVAGRWLRRPVPAPPPRAVACLAVYGVVLLASVLWALEPSVAWSQALDYCVAAAIALVVVAFLMERGSLRLLAWALLAGAAFLGVLGIVQVVTGAYDTDFLGFARASVEHIAGERSDYRLSGPFSDPNFYGQWMVVAVGLGIDRVRSEADALLRGLALAITALSTAVVVLTFSRGAFIALVLLAIATAWRSRHRGRMLLALGALLLAAPLVAPAAYTDRLAATFTVFAPSESDDPAIRGRSSELKVGLLIFADHPLVGVGPGGYAASYLPYARQVGLDQRREDRQAHNLYLEAAAETGVVGLGALGILITVAYLSLRRARAEAPAAATAGLDGLRDGLTAFLVTSLFLHGAYSRLLWLLVAAAIAAPAIQRPPPARRSLPARERVLS